MADFAHPPEGTTWCAAALATREAAAAHYDQQDARWRNIAADPACRHRPALRAMALEIAGQARDAATAIRAMALPELPTTL